MKIQSFDLIQISEFPDAPPAMERLVEKVNLHINDITVALFNRVSIGDNLNAEVRAITVAQDTPIVLRLQTLSGKPIHALLLATSVFDYARLAWRVVEESLVEIKVKFDNTPATDPEVVVAFLGS